MVDDILSEAPLYQYLVAQGKEEGLKKGLKEGLEKGMEKGLEKGMEKGMAQGIEEGIERGIAQGSVLTSRKALLAIFHERFPQLNLFAQKAVPTLGKSDILEQLIVKIALAKDEEEARKHLLAALQQNG